MLANVQKGILNFEKETPVIIQKGIIQSLIQRESSSSDAFVDSLNHSIVLGRIFFRTFIKRCFLKYVFFLNSRFLEIFVVPRELAKMNSSPKRLTTLKISDMKF